MGRIVADNIVAALERHGVSEIFGQSIPSKVFLAAAERGMRQVGYRTENAGAAMADAYARVSGKVAVVAAQNGPAAALLVPGLAEAFKASIPVVALVQDVAIHSRDRNAFQELDHFRLFSGVAKSTRRIDSADRVEDAIDMAFVEAASGRPGPVVLMVPVDIIDEPVEEANAVQSRRHRYGRYPLDRTLADPSAVAEAADLLASSRRPVAIVGGGVHTAGAYAEVEALQRLGVPVATTVMGKGAVDETSPMSVGVVGYFMAEGSRTERLRFVVEEADVVLLIGNRTNQNGTDSWSLYPEGATYIHIDVDGREVGRNYEAMRLVGDAKLTLAALMQALEERDLSALEDWSAKVAERISHERASFDKRLAGTVALSATPIRPERILRDLDGCLDDNSLVVADASYSSIWVANYLTARKPGRRFLTPRGLAGLGWGLPFALGAKAAMPDATVHCVTGDGGFGHVWAEMETAVRMRLPVIITLLNNQTLGYQMHSELVLHGNYTDICHFSHVNHAGIANACGVRGVRITHPDDYLVELRRAIDEQIPTLLEVIIDPDAYPPITSYQSSDMLPNGNQTRIEQ